MFFLDIIKINIKLILIAGIIITIFFVVVKFLIDYFQNKKINSIINSYKFKKKNIAEKDVDNEKKFSKRSDYYKQRERKLGLTWGGGNIKGANATRGTKKQFLNK